MSKKSVEDVPEGMSPVLGWKSVDCGLSEEFWEVSELDMAKALRFNLMEHIFGIRPNVDRHITYKGSIQPARDCRP